MTDERAATIPVSELFDVLRADAERYRENRGWRAHPGFWVGASHRLKNWARAHDSRFVRLGVGVPARALGSFFRHAFNVHIVSGAELGSGLYLIHPRNILIGPAKIGPNCMIFHDVTLGTNANGPGYPTIGADVSLFVGCRVLGEVTVGDRAKIGANCVVTASVPPGSVVIPASNRIIPAAIVAAFGASANPMEVQTPELKRDLARSIAEAAVPPPDSETTEAVAQPSAPATQTDGESGPIAVMHASSTRH